MSVTGKTCRLCMSTESLTDLFKIDGDTTLDKKIRYCIDLKMTNEDGLPDAICKICEKNVRNFYDFKQKCLFVDGKLRSMKNYLCTPNKLPFDDSDFDNLKMDVKLESDLFSKLDEFKNTFDGWLSDDTDSFYVNCFNYQSPAKVEEIKSTLGQTNDTVLSNAIKTQIKIESPKLKKENYQKSIQFQCEICGRIVKNKSALAKHIATHSGTKQFPCKLCSKTFTRAEHTVVHMRSHLGIKPFICEICGKASTKYQDLIRHMKIHSDERKYACPRCDRRFKRSSDVHSHVRTHTGVKPYKCMECNKSYSSRNGLKKHYKSHCKRANAKIKELG